ncbi:hypothetical protein GCM10027167_25000 [Nocardia heshunensis]
MPSAEWHILEDRSGIHLQNVPLGDEICSGARDYDVGIGGRGWGRGAMLEHPELPLIARFGTAAVPAGERIELSMSVRGIG